MGTDKKKNKNRAALFTGIGVFLVIIGISIALNYGTIKDIIVGMGYRPSSEMSEIRANLELANTGYRIFNATMPALMEKEEFNQNCRERESETAILGCYKDDRVYVYNIVNDELSGIRELASAHELLHAVYDRMSATDKRSFEGILDEVYQQNKDILGEEVELYDESEKKEEIYVRAGTEIKELPEKLEKHYAEIFRDQDKIVDFYESYIKVFREIEKNMKDLLVKIQTKEAEINNKNTAYKTEAETLNKDINEFNDCAKTPDCFTSRVAFNNKRQSLIERENALSRTYEEINAMIAEYNKLVAEYNENILHGQILNTAINSGSQTPAQMEDF